MLRKSKHEIYRVSNLDGGALHYGLFLFMAMRPAPAMAQQTPIYGPDGKYQGSVFNYGRTQIYTDRNGHFSGSAINNGKRTRS